jgi:hypothetical protein
VHKAANAVLCLLKGLPPRQRYQVFLRLVAMEKTKLINSFRL